MDEQIKEGISSMSARKPPPPVRLSVILARQASVGVILKRGPSSWVQMIKWHTDTDTFEMGQWFKGRIYERSCSLSPNGQFLIYKALGYSHRIEYGSARWTGISRVPYFAPLALWPSTGRSGGGRFINDGLVALDGHTIEAHPKYQPQGLRVVFLYDNTEDLGTQIEPKHYIQWTRIDRFDAPNYDVFARQLPNKSVEEYCYEYPRMHEFFYVDRLTDKKYELRKATWADFDQQGRFVLAKEGKLFAGTLENGELKLTELADFNGMKPDPQPAPDWAQQW